MQEHRTPQKNLRLELLDEEQRRTVYIEHMKEDFPPAELKSLEEIEQGITKGCYRILGLMDQNEVIGYVCLVEEKDACPIDYLAVIPERRNSGAGSEMLRLLEKRLQDREYVIVEVERPSLGENEDEVILRRRRMGFYFRSGILDTGIDVRCFGEGFRILEARRNETHRRSDIIQRYRDLYQCTLPVTLYGDYIQLE